MVRPPKFNFPTLTRSKLTSEQDVDKALQTLDTLQQTIAKSDNTEQELEKIAKVLSDNPQIVKEKGYNYLQAFAQEFPNRKSAQGDPVIPSGNSSNISRIVAVCIMRNAIQNKINPDLALKSVESSIAAGQEKSISIQRSSTNETLTTNVLLALSGDDQGNKRILGGLTSALVKNNLVSSQEAPGIATSFHTKYPLISAIVANVASGGQKNLASDMITVIGHGSAIGEGSIETRAVHYKKFQEFGEEITGKFKQYLKSEQLESAEVKNYFNKASLQTLDYIEKLSTTGPVRASTPAKIQEYKTKLENELKTDINTQTFNKGQINTKTSEMRKSLTWISSHRTSNVTTPQVSVGIRKSQKETLTI